MISKTSLIFFLSLLLSTSIHAVSISHVQHDKGLFNPAKNEQVTIRFNLSEPAKVVMNIFDGRRLLMRSVSSEGMMDVGDNQLIWDGKDTKQRFVPSEAYHYTLVATGADKKIVEYDVTDLSGGEVIKVQNVQWDAKHKQLSYRLKKAARVNIRFGLKDGGPLLHTLLNWVARPVGNNKQPWNGKDAAGVLDLTNHKKLDVSVQAYALSSNTIIVGPLTDKVELQNNPPHSKASQRIVKKIAEPRMHDRRQHSIETRGDFPIKLQLDKTVQRNADGIAMLSGRVPLRMVVDEAYRTLALNRRMEPVFYIDGLFAFEIETGYLPITWQWDTTAVNPGKHYITANLRGYEGNFGMTTLEVIVVPATKANQKAKP